MQAVFIEYVSSLYDYKTFNITLANKIIGSKINQFWTSIIERHMQFLTYIFENCVSKVITFNVQQIMAFKLLIPDNTLCPLFFPDDSNLYTKILKGKLAMEEAYFVQGLGMKSCPYMNPTF
ncbi:hypothetical protein FQN52_004844 [Onygenales sp. PD_12]|nr:hypothetical protein FQN52_004844 [Onygenales sp. PD_12]